MGPRFRAQNWDRKICHFSRERSARSGLFCSPGGAKWPCPGASPGPAADQVCSSPESQSIAGPSVSYAASAVSDFEAGLTRHRTLLDAGSPSRESTAARELNKTEPALFGYSVLSPSRTTASLLEISQLLRVPACLSSSLVSPRVFCPVCQRLRFLPDLVLRPRRHILPPTLPVVHKFYGGSHIQSHNPDAQSSSHLERPRPVTSTLPGLGTASHTCSLAFNLLFNFSNCHCQLLQFALPTILHGPSALTRKALTVGTTA